MDKVMELERDLAVHLAECNGRYKVIEADLKGLSAKLDDHMETTKEYREKVLAASSQLKQTLVYGFLGLLAAVVLGPDNGLKLVTTLIRGAVP